MGTKGKDFLSDAERAGWEGSIEVNNGQEICTVLFKDDNNETQTLVMVWDGSRYNDKLSHRLTHKGERRAIRNASAARDILTRASGVAVKAEPKAVARVDAQDVPLHTKPPQRPDTKNLPFKISQPDKEILAAVLGKEIVWWSFQRKQVESARVMSDPNQRQLKLMMVKGKRVLHWAAWREGFRAVRLEDIIEVRK